MVINTQLTAYGGNGQHGLLAMKVVELDQEPSIEKRLHWQLMEAKNAKGTPLMLKAV